MQLLGVVIPKLEEWQDEGQTGQKKITQWTRYLTVALALMQSTALVFVMKSGNGGLLGESGFTLPQGTVLIHPFTAFRAAVIVLTWTAGTALVMWLAELITQRGIGNGMSILIFASVVSRVPLQGGALLAESGGFKFTVIFAIGLVMILAIVAVESGQRRIPVQFAKRVVGRRMYGGQSTYIPLKVNQSGVIPVIFASSLLSFPAILATVLPWAGAKTWINNNLVGVEHAELVLHRRVRRADPVLRVLLHVDRVQPGPAGRHHPQAGRVHSRHPSGAADRAVPRARS